MSKTRIPASTKRDLWFAAHGRCEFRGCNKRLNISGASMDQCNISNYAHIIADSEDGPRGCKKSQELAKSSDNLILLCPECHKLVDNEGAKKYTVEILKEMKREHEDRIERVTAIQPAMKTLVVTYRPKIHLDQPFFSKDVLNNCIFPERYPATFEPIEIQMKNSSLNDSDPEFWSTESLQMQRVCNDRILPYLDNAEISHISLFAMGPQPLLVKLGTILNDKYNVRVYQKHRIPDTWRWLENNTKNDIFLIKPEKQYKDPVLVIALSAGAIKERIIGYLGDSHSIWTITCTTPDNDMMKTRYQFEQFNRIARQTLDEIKTAHKDAETLKIFLAAPASCAVELGRIRMAKADLKWDIYDYQQGVQFDLKTITIE